MNGDGPSGHLDGSGDLWEAVLEARDTKQRGAIFAWSVDAHDRGLTDDEIVGRLWLAVVEKEIRSRLASRLTRGIRKDSERGHPYGRMEAHAPRPSKRVSGLR